MSIKEPLWLVFHRMASPHFFYTLSGRLLPYCALLTALLLTVGLVGGLVYAPADYEQGDGFRIIYVHVPSAWMSLFIYAVMALNSAIFLVWRIKLADIICPLQCCNRRLVYLVDVAHRLNLGQADVGDLVGLGCAPDLRTDPVISCTWVISAWSARLTTAGWPARPRRCWRWSAPSTSPSFITPSCGGIPCTSRQALRSLPRLRFTSAC